MAARLPRTLFEQAQEFADKNPDREVRIERGDVRIVLCPVYAPPSSRDDTEDMIVP